MRHVYMMEKFFGFVLNLYELYKTAGNVRHISMIFIKCKSLIVSFSKMNLMFNGFPTKYYNK